MVAMERIRDTFNSFLRHGQKLFEANVIDHLIMNLNAPQRLTGITPTNYRKLTGKPLASAKKAARKKIVARFRDIFQRRHDCIHNCDRPKLALQQLTPSSTKKVLQDIALLVEYCDSHFESEFNEYLRTVGANAQTRNAAGYSG